jgi:glycosyltransferase involved in cell wall biosynthesis
MPGARSDVHAFLQMFDIFVLPSLGEGISNTVLEAMASGLPVVATHVGGNPELIEDEVNGYLVPVGDAEMLAARLRKLINDPLLRQEMGSRGCDKVNRQFNWDRTVDSYLSIYDEVLAAG